MALNMRNVKTSAPVSARAGRKALVCKAASAPVSQSPMNVFDTFLFGYLGRGLRYRGSPECKLYTALRVPVSSHCYTPLDPIRSFVDIIGRCSAFVNIHVLISYLFSVCAYDGALHISQSMFDG